MGTTVGTVNVGESLPPFGIEPKLPSPLSNCTYRAIPTGNSRVTLRREWATVRILRDIPYLPYTLKKSTLN
jgi:hypothetical protein